MHLVGVGILSRVGCRKSATILSQKSHVGFVIGYTVFKQLCHHGVRSMCYRIACMGNIMIILYCVARSWFYRSLLCYIVVLMVWEYCHQCGPNMPYGCTLGPEDHWVSGVVVVLACC